MNYYIQGEAARAEEIKAAFEKLGYNTRVNGWNFNSDRGVYFTNEADKSVDYTSNETFVNLIKTHHDYKVLELPVKPKFKIGDRVIYCGKERTITFMDDHFYDFDGGCAGCRIELQDGLLRPAPKPHYDIKNFKPFDKVLIRVGNNSKWTCDFFCYYHNGCFHCVGTDDWSQCIPFKGNEHLLGTTDMCDECYINW